MTLPSPIRHLVMFSGGVCSWAAAKRVVERHGKEGVVLLFADTKMEDEDLYRFLDEAAANVGAPLVKIADGRTPWEVFDDEKMLGNTRFDPCSKHLKRLLLDRWQKASCGPAMTVLHFGLDWTEADRLERLRARREGWQVEGYMTEEPYLTKEQMLDWLRREGIEPPRLYGLGFHHNNCGGFCIKSGQAQFALLLKTMPERYAYHEGMEEAFRIRHNFRHTILRDRRGGQTRTMSLREFRERIEAKQSHDEHEWGGCGCAVD